MAIESDVPPEDKRDSSCLDEQKVRGREIIAHPPAEASRQTSLELRYHVGPLPDPETLARYNEVIPNGADRIMRLAEGQASHRREMERTIVTGQKKQEERGQLLGFAIGVLFIVAAVVVALRGHDAVAGILGGSSVISVVGAFILGRRAHGHASDSERKEDRP